MNETVFCVAACVSETNMMMVGRCHVFYHDTRCCWAGQNYQVLDQMKKLPKYNKKGKQLR